MPVTIPDSVLAAAHLTEPELRRELAVALFREERLTLGQACILRTWTSSPARNQGDLTTTGLIGVHSPAQYFLTKTHCFVLYSPHFQTISAAN